MCGPGGSGLSRASGWRTATRLVVTLDSGLETSTELRILAHAQVPSEGEWTIPGLRPLDAIWTGGTTTVFLDEFHVLKECREKAGRLVFPSSPDSGPVDRLEFESGSPRSVAELVFHGPRADTSCAVRGRLFVAGSPARLECELNWAVHDGIDARARNRSEPGVASRPGRDPGHGRSGGLASVGVALGQHAGCTWRFPSATMTPKELVVIVRASSTASGGRGPLQLPRVRPVGARMIDEAWVAWVDQGTMIQPTLARGLAWIDPREVPGLVALAPAGSDLREALAWRWIAEQRRRPRGSGTNRAGARRLDSPRMRGSTPPAAVSCSTAVFLVYAGAGSLDSVPLWIGQADGLLEPWRFTRPCRRAARDRADRRARPLPARFPQGRVWLAASSSRYPIRPKKPFNFMRNTRGISMA